MEGFSLYSPGKSIDRTFRAVFELPPPRRGNKAAKRKPSRTYRNPVLLAREWAEAMEAGNLRSQRAFARAIGLSHTRVSQLMGLLRLCPDARETLKALGEPLYSHQITERRLRSLVNMTPPKKQKRMT